MTTTVDPRGRCLPSDPCAHCRRVWAERRAADSTTKPLPGDADYVSRPLAPEQEARLEQLIEEAVAERYGHA